MKRQEILDEFNIDDRGIIRNPGKFEGEMIYAPYFSDTASYGEELSIMEDGCGEYVSLIEIDDDDRREFPEIEAETKYMGLVESDNGFVTCTELNESEANRWRTEYEQDEELEDINDEDDLALVLEEN